MAIAYSYIRFSTPEQLKGDSLRRQLELSERYAKANNLSLDTSLTFEDKGNSAFHGRHIKKGALGAFLAKVEQGVVKPGSFLLVESLDRLSREQVTVALSTFTSILDNGISIVTLTDGQVYSHEGIKENWTSLVLSISIMARAHEESAIKSKRLLAAWGQKIKNARAGGKKISKTCPAWLELSEDRARFITIPGNVALVKRVYKMAKEGMGSYSIERILNAEKIPAMGFSSDWHRSYILNILTNRAVIGEYQYFSGKGKDRKAVGDPIRDYYPQIISNDDFYLVQKIMSSRKTNAAGRKGAKVPNLLTGLCKCGYCGGTMNYIDKGKGYDSLIFLVCSTAKRGIGCKHVPWRYSEVERLVLNFVVELKVEDFSDDDGTTIYQELSAAQGKLEQLNTAQTKIMEAIEAAPSVPLLVPRLLELQAEIDQVKKREQELSALYASGDSVEQRLQGLKELREQLSHLCGDELYRLRMRVLSELKQLLEWVKFFPLGIDPTSSSEYANFSYDDVVFHGLGQGKEHRYMVLRFRGGKTLSLLLNGIEKSGGIEKFAEDNPIEDESAY